MIVRKLNADGRTAFAQWIDDGGKGDAPLDLLTADGTSDALPLDVEVDIGPFDTRYDMGVHLVEALKPLGASLWFDEELWDWLALYYIDQSSAAVGGVRKLQARERYVLELRNRKWSRHLVRMSWLAVQEHGENARVLLNTPPHGHSEVLEQLAGQQELFGAKPLIAAARRMYWNDADGGGLKRGAQGKGPGTPRRLRRIMSQFRRTWDPNTMTADQLIELLPAEFDRWKKVPAELSGGAETHTAPSA